MKICENGVVREMTEQERLEHEKLMQIQHAPEPTPTIDDLAEMLKILGG